MIKTSHGVCSSCIHELACTYPRDLENPPLNCEEYELGHRPVEDPPAIAADPADETPSLNLKGICSNCDERATCTYPKPDGGVWRCEEYR